VRDLPVQREFSFASRHGAPFRPVSVPHARQSVCGTSVRLDTESVFRFRTAVASDRLLPPTTYPIANPRSRFSSRVPAIPGEWPFTRRGAWRFTTSKLASAGSTLLDGGCRPGTCRPCMSRESEIRFDLGLWHSCRPSVSVAPPSQAIFRAPHRGLGCVLPRPREGQRPRNNPKCLPSEVRARAFEHVIDPGRHRLEDFSSAREPHQLEMGWSDEISPCHSKRSATVFRRHPRFATSRSSSRPRSERLPPRGLRSGPPARFSEPRYRLPISATRFRHAGTPVSRRSSPVRGCRPCPPCSCDDRL